MPEIEKVIIIGGGPAGLAAAVYTARANLSPLVFAGSPPGGQLILTSDVENYPGFESILGPQLIDRYRAHAKKFGTRIVDDNVGKVDFTRKPFEIYDAASEKIYRTESVIIATGAKAIWLGLENEQRLRGKGVSACATCDAFFFKNKVVAVVGGGDTAMEDALTLTKFASKVYIIHRRNEFRASKIMQERVFKNPKIEIVWDTMVMDLLGKDKVEGVKIKKLKEEKESEIKLDGLFLAIGHQPDTEVFKGQIELDKKGYIITFARLAEDYLSGKQEVDSEKLAKIRSGVPLFGTHTSVRGVFAAGDCVDYVYRQAGTAVGMGIAAALDVEKWLETHKE